MTAEPYPWHKTQWQSLLARYRNNALPHALLFSGPAGLGKNHLASCLVQMLLCRQPDTQGQACGTCKSCMVFRGQAHPDYRRLTPSERGNIIGIDSVREVSEFLGLKSQFQGPKTVIISGAEKMNRAASNSLLKTLEEPPEQSYLILVTTHAAALPSTIRSRCQKVACNPPAEAEAAAWLAQQAVLPVDPQLVLRLANGAPLAAIEMLDHGWLEKRQTMFQQLEAMIAGTTDPLTVAEAWLKLGIDETLYWMYSWIVDMIRIHFTGNVTDIHNQDLRDGLQRIASQMKSDRLYEHLDQANRALRLANTQVNKQLLLEELMISWATR